MRERTLRRLKTTVLTHNSLELMCNYLYYVVYTRVHTDTMHDARHTWVNQLCARHVCFGKTKAGIQVFQAIHVRAEDHKQYC